MVKVAEIDTPPTERDGDVGMTEKNEQGPEEPPPRLMITKMVCC